MKITFFFTSIEANFKYMRQIKNPTYPWYRHLLYPPTASAQKFSSDTVTLVKTKHQENFTITFSKTESWAYFLLFSSWLKVAKGSREGLTGQHCSPANLSQQEQLPEYLLTSLRNFLLQSPEPGFLPELQPAPAFGIPKMFLQFLKLNWWQSS